MLKAVIFDMDGVVADSHRIHIHAWRKLLSGLGKQLRRSDIELLYDGRKKEELLRILLGSLPEDQVSLYGEEKDTLFLAEMHNMAPVRGIRQVLCELAHASVPMAVASAGSRTRVQQTLQVLELREYFQVVVTGDDAPNGKSDPDIFLQAAKRLQIPCDGALVFEDSVSGIRSALAAGMKCIGIAGHDRAPALMLAGAIAVTPDFTGMTLEQIEHWCSAKCDSQDDEASANSTFVGEPAVAYLENR